MDVAALVCAGVRPPLPPTVDSDYADLLTRMWQQVGRLLPCPREGTAKRNMPPCALWQDPSARPAAAEVERELEGMRRTWLLNESLSMEFFQPQTMIEVGPASPAPRLL
jgi:hypothetical protein